MKVTESTTRVSNLEGYILVVDETQRPTNEGPTGLKAGMWLFNDTAKSLDIYDGSAWRGFKMTAV